MKDFDTVNIILSAEFVSGGTREKMITPTPMELKVDEIVHFEKWREYIEVCSRKILVLQAQN